MVLFGGARAAGFLDQASFDAATSRVEEAAVHALRVGVRIRAPAMILYTSGTSSHPKGCLISHEAITREAAE